MKGHPLSLHPRLRPRGAWVATGLNLPTGKNFAAVCAPDSMCTVVSGPSVLPQTMAPPTEMVSPPELSPIHKIPLNIPTPTFVPGTPRLTRDEVARLPSETDTEHDFEDLIAVLSELSASGGSPRFSNVLSLMKDRKPEAIETADAVQFTAYLRLAESAGIVIVEKRKDGYWWVTLRNQRSANPDIPPQQTPLPHARSRFRDLINTLNDLRLTGDSEPQFFVVGPRLLRMNPSVYKDAGVRGFEDYIRAAVKAGVVTVHGVKNGDGSLKLCSAHCNPPLRSSTHTRAASTPPTPAASTASPFTLLVDFLKSRQLTSGRPISFSEVLTHLVSTHPDLVSLCTSVPGVTTVDQYINAAVASGVVSLVGGTTASRDALVSLRVGLPQNPSPLAQPSGSTMHPPTVPSRQETTVSPLSVNVTPNSFRDLAAVLIELRRSVARFSDVIPLLLKRKPDAYESVGVARFMDYVTLAMENGVVTARGMGQGDGWVSLSISNPKPEKPANSLQSSKPSEGGKVAATPSLVNLKGGGVGPKFVDLVETIGEIWKKGEKTPRLSRVGAELLQDEGRRDRTLNACGVIKFKPYAELARDAGIIEIYGQPGKETILLDPTIRVKAGYI